MSTAEDTTTRLHVHLDAALPRAVAVGAGTALWVCGWCVSPDGLITDLTFEVDGTPQPVMAFGMPRIDVMRALHPAIDPYASEGIVLDADSEDDPGLHSYRSGFWGLVHLARAPAGTVHDVRLRATLDGGGTAVATLGAVEDEALPAPVPVVAPVPSGGGPLVAVCMATYEPPMDLLRPQLDSIRAQTHANWVCIISDDCSSPDAFAELEEEVAGDARFILSRSPRNLGFYHNFERALALVPDAVEFVAMSDQDDVWHPDKLAVLLAEIGDARLIYSDARIVSREGEVLADTYWSTRGNNHSSLLSLLVANAVSGSATLMRRDLLEDALPFPPAQFSHFHDHWLGLVALAIGDIAFVDRPLYDYVQHGEASLGHAAATQMMSLRTRLGSLKRDPRERIRMWRMHYFVDVGRLTQVATVLQDRVGPRMPRGKRKTLENFLRTDRSLPQLAKFWARGARELLGRPETLGAEWMLAYAFMWRRLLTATTRDRPQRGLRLDAVPPPTFAPKPGLKGTDITIVREISDKVASLILNVTDDAPERVNVLVPNIDLEHFFGGYIAKFNLARKLAERGLRVRIVTIDPQPPLPSTWRAQLEAYAGLGGLFAGGRVEVAFGREEGGIEVSRTDRFVASTWWSAHVAADAASRLDAGRFVYLVQEYEPFTFPMGTYAALAATSYDHPHRAIFSTELLRDYFRRHGIGVYAEGTSAGDANSLSFENAITAVDPPEAAELAGRTTKRLLFYARPEPHAARNMFELGVLALNRALETGVFRGGWELHGIGTTNPARQMLLGGGTPLELLPRTEQSAYAEQLRQHDVGLSLMYTPHPSLVPIEMASAGMLTVTNTFENKTAEALAELSPNLLAVAPTVEGIVAGLRAAVAGSTDHERRAAGARISWSKSWEASFGEDLLDQVTGWLSATT